MRRGWRHEQTEQVCSGIPAAGAHKDYARRLYQRWVRVPVRTAPFNYRLLELVSRLHSRLLDRSRPLWEQHVIDGLPGDRFAFYSKLQAIIARRVAKAQPDTDVQSLHLWFESVRTLGADWVRSRVRRLAARRRFFVSGPAISSGMPGHSRSRPAHCSRRFSVASWRTCPRSR